MGVTDETPDPAVNAALAKRHTAEAAKFKAEARQFNAEAAWKEQEYENGKLDLERNLDVRRRELTNDYYLRIYPFTSSVDSNTVKGCINQLNVWHRLEPTAPAEIIFTSPGGSVVDGLALYDHILYLRDAGMPINTVAIGMAASMAGILLQAGEKRILGRESWLMIHEVSFGTHGKIGEIEDTTAWVKAVQRRVLNIFSARSKMSVRQLDTKWKRKDWWIDSDEALRLGLIDEVR
jgi:ATP-dependent Clp endopeptidase proteolytic subunit ClpP